MVKSEVSRPDFGTIWAWIRILTLGNENSVGFNYKVVGFCDTANSVREYRDRTKDLRRQEFPFQSRRQLARVYR
jgi:hypothetical protein